MGMYSDCPCRYCVPPVRYPGCHGQCEERKAWDLEKQVIKDKITQEKEKEYQANSLLIDSTRRVMKYTRKKGYNV